MSNQEFYETLINSLPQIEINEYRNGKWSDVMVRPHAFIDSEGRFLISAEYGDGFANYYDCGYPYIHPSLEKWAVENGGYFEWQHPGAICFITS
ncbi:MAG: hypothetical protein CMQ40_05095 [Gammaproteobacteria bacterium]|nr:hypothetical protein [Gammaproteobacteria bacterium]